MKKFMEPFKIKSVEPIGIFTRKERETILKEAGYNVFKIKAEKITIDLLTDSGTSAMSSKQWAAIMDGDESYAGARSYFKLEKVLHEVIGFKHFVPTHQGRAAERILFSIISGPGRHVPNNTHFDTTRANVEYAGMVAKDIPIPEGRDPSSDFLFKGNMDTSALKTYVEKVGVKNIPLIMLTVTNNSIGGHPVSMANIRQVSKMAKGFGIPLFFDACRFAENAFLIKEREPGYKDKSVREIVREMFSYADGCTMSAKKDGLVNIGGFLGFNSDELAEKAKNLLILTEGFPTYGGLAGRDLEAMAQGLEEVLDENYLEYRINHTRYLGEELMERSVPIIRPVGAHGVYLNARDFLPHVPPKEFPGQSIVCELYLEAGIRGVEIGTLMFGKTDGSGGEEEGINHMDLVRLAIPRRVYTQSHLDYVIDAIAKIYKRRESLKGYRIVKESRFLRHFTCELEPL